MNPTDEIQDRLPEDSPRITRRLALALGIALATGTAAQVYAHDDHDDDKDEDKDDNSGHGSDHDDHDDKDRDSAFEDCDEPDDDDAACVFVPGEVHITDDDADGFVPASITVAPGETVTWFNDDDKPHTATGADFDTGPIQPGESATVTFDEGGSFAYSCQFHPMMTGSVEVGDAGTPEASPAATPAASGSAVTIVNIAFDPPTLEVAVGATVTWTNEDGVQHTATADDGSFDTGAIEQGGTAEVTFNTAGTFAYTCAFHPGMHGEIVVS